MAEFTGKKDAFMKMQSKKEMFKGSSDLQRNTLHVSPPVYLPEDQTRANFVLNPNVVKGKTNTEVPFWLVKPSHLGKAFEIMSMKSDKPEGEYVEAVLESLRGSYDRRKVPGGPDNSAWYTDKQERYNYRVLSGTITFYGLPKNDRAAFLAETEKVKSAIQKILTYETFIEDFTFSCFLETSARGQDVMHVLEEIEN